MLLIAIGVVAGVLSGAFGIGSGVLVVPALLMWANMPPRVVAGTALAAMLPVAAVGAVTYDLAGNVDWLAAMLLALGMLCGAPLGSRVLGVLPVRMMQVVFLVALLAIVVGLWLVVPTRDQQIVVDGAKTVWLIVTGLVAGVFSGSLGISGGIIVVPVLMFFFGASDLVARGTSLLMLIPGALSGAIANWRLSNVDLKAAAFICISGMVGAPFGVMLASAVSPLVGNIALSVFLLLIFVQLLVRNMRAARELR